MSRSGSGRGAGSLSVAVVGGSISGCLAAALLDDAGHDVTVFERSPNDLLGRGGGIATSGDVVARMKRDGLIEADFPSVPHRRLRLAKRTAGHEREGRCPWAAELDMECVLWSGLFAALRRRIAPVDYRLGKTLVDVVAIDAGEADGPRPKRLRFADGSEHEADLVVFCDGFRSTGRHLMFPDLALDYRNLVIWRGTLPERDGNVGGALDEHPRVSLASMPGSFITYLMPGESGSVERGERVINWATYLPVAAGELPATMIDREGRRRESTIPAGQLPPERERELKTLLRAQLPSVFADIVERSRDTAYQPVRVCRAPAQARDGLCLVGDAAVPIQPLTGAGLFKAYEDARTLARATREGPSLETALRRWSETRTALNKRLLETGYALERVMIWNTIDLATSDAGTVERWWREHVAFPPEYSYLKSA